jgi:hypothetical protein
VLYYVIGSTNKERNMPDLTPAQFQAITARFGHGIDVYPANRCWGVVSGRVSYYVFFEGDHIVRVIID